MEKILNYALILMVICILGCAATAGRNFERASNDLLILGNTTSTDIIIRTGLPFKEGTIIKNGMEIITFTYFYTVNPAENFFGTGVIAQRVQQFNFFENKLIGYEFWSSFKDDNTDFDDKVINQIKKGVSTRLEVEKLLGPPAGKTIYPLISKRDEEMFIYSYSQWIKMKFYRKRLQVTFDNQNIVTEIDYTVSGQK